MSKLHLTSEDFPSKIHYEDRMFEILRDFLQPDSALSTRETALDLLALIPDGNNYSDEACMFADTCLELAQQIPYHHPSQFKLADLLETTVKAAKVNGTYLLTPVILLIYPHPFIFTCCA